MNSGRSARSLPPWSLNAYSSRTIPGPDFAVNRSRLSNVGVETSRKPKDSASWMNRDSTKRRLAISSGPQSFVPRGRSNMKSTPMKGSRHKRFWSGRGTDSINREVVPPEGLEIEEVFRRTGSHHMSVLHDVAEIRDS